MPPAQYGWRIPIRCAASDLPSSVLAGHGSHHKVCDHNMEQNSIPCSSIHPGFQLERKHSLVLGHYHRRHKNLELVESSKHPHRANRWNFNSFICLFLNSHSPHRKPSLLVYHWRDVQQLLLSQPCNSGWRHVRAGAHRQNHCVAWLCMTASFLKQFSLHVELQQDHEEHLFPNIWIHCSYKCSRVQKPHVHRDLGTDAMAEPFFAIII